MSESPSNWAGWGHIGGIGGLVLSAYLILAGIGMLIEKAVVPGWFMGIVALAAGVLILVGR